MWVLTLESLPAPTYLISLIIPTQPRPVAPVGQLALALWGVSLSQGSCCLPLIKVIEKRGKKEREGEREGERGGKSQDEQYPLPLGRVLKVFLGLGQEWSWLGDCVGPERMYF